MRLARTAALALAAGVVVLTAPAASAVQTDTFGLQAQGDRPALTHESNGRSVRDEIVVYNRTNKPVTLMLDVISAERDAEGTFQYGASQAGLAKHVSMPTGAVTLAPQETKALPVEISAPASTALRYAAITATALTPQAEAGPLAVQERLAVFVQLQPTGSNNPLLRTTERRIATGIAVTLITVMLVCLAQQRRRKTALVTV